MDRAAQSGFANSFDQLDQAGAFRGSARATDEHDQTGERRFGDQSEKVVSDGVRKTLRERSSEAKSLRKDHLAGA